MTVHLLHKATPVEKFDSPDFEQQEVYNLKREQQQIS